MKDSLTTKPCVRCGNEVDGFQCMSCHKLQGGCPVCEDNVYQDCANCRPCKKPFLTQKEILDAHAEFGKLNRVLTKEAMGLNWPRSWDLIGKDGMFE